MKKTLESTWVVVDASAQEEPDIAEEILASLGIEPASIVNCSARDIGVDTFSFYINKSRYLLHYAYGNNGRFEIENKFLSKCHFLATQTLFKSGVYNFCGEDVEYIITAHDFAEPLSENLGFLTAYFDTFWQIHRLLCAQNIKTQTVNQFINQQKQRWLLAKPFVQHQEMQWLHDLVDQCIKNMRKLGKDVAGAKTVCHGNLATDNIIVAFDKFKINNWRSAFNGTPVFDMCYLAIEFGHNRDSVIELYRNVYKQDPENLDNIFEFAANAFLLRQLCDFCYWAFTKSKSDGSLILSSADKLETLLDNNGNMFSSDDIRRLRDMMQNIYVNTPEDELVEIDDD